MKREIELKVKPEDIKMEVGETPEGFPCAHYMLRKDGKVYEGRGEFNGMDALAVAEHIALIQHSPELYENLYVSIGVSKPLGKSNYVEDPRTLVVWQLIEGWADINASVFENFVNSDELDMENH